jgi:glycosyltransferase involved in cell wall biosynthesis
MKSEMEENIWIVIPAYNEEPVIKKLIEDINKFYLNIVVVDDCSTDQTSIEIQKTNAWYLKHIINLGQGAALQTGITFALSKNASFIVTFDADGQHFINDVILMYDEIKKNPTDVLLGSRFLGQAIGMSLKKKIILRLARIYTGLSSGLWLTDAHNGLRIFSRHAASNIEITQNRMSHASQIIDIIAKKKIRFREFPVHIIYTDYSLNKGQKISNSISIIVEQFINKFFK